MGRKILEVIKKMWGEIPIQLMKLFCNRVDVHAKQFLQKNGTKGFSCEKKLLDLDLIKKHLNDKYYIGVYQLSSESKVKWICFDFDENTELDFHNAKKLYDYLDGLYLYPLAEKSGGGDYKTHIWIFCEDIEAKYAKAWAEQICLKAKVKPHEIFPKQEKINENEYGNLVKLPLGINLSTNKKSFLLDDNFKEILGKEVIEDKLKKCLDNLRAIEKIEKQEVKQSETTNYQTTLKANDYDNFFNFVINNELPAGVTVGEREGSIQGINDNILKNEAIWFYQKGFDLDRLEQEIKPIFDEHNWVFGDLKGWFKKAEKGDIKEISKGELVNWCKTYFKDLFKLLPYESPYLEIRDLKYNTSHLPHYESLDKTISLIGGEYKLFKKDAYNLLISLACPESLLNIKIGRIETDLRIHPLYIIPSGKGKLELKEGIKKIYFKFNPEANIKEPRTIHYQQLIGKVLKRKDKDENGKKIDVWIKKMGFLFSDLLILEESYEILTSNEKNDVDARDALIVGLDIFGKNLIQKQNIDNLDSKDETIEGFPHVRCMAFTQPLPFPEKFITKGSQRRFSLNYKEFPKRTKFDRFVIRLNKPINTEESASLFAAFMRKINNIRGNWNFEKDAFDIFLISHKALLEQGYSKPGKQSNFTNIIEFPLQNLLLKISAIRALGHLRTTITKSDILWAYCDIVERFTHELMYVEEKVKGLFDYGASWGGATGKQQECLEWLWNRGAKSKEDSQTFIAYFQRQISNIYDISFRRARDRYNEMKEEGLIKDYKGSHDSKVWITFEPDIIQSGQSSQSGHLSKSIYTHILNQTGQSGQSSQSPKCNISKSTFSYVEKLFELVSTLSSPSTLEDTRGEVKNDISIGNEGVDDEE